MITCSTWCCSTCCARTCPTSLRSCSKSRWSMYNSMVFQDHGLSGSLLSPPPVSCDMTHSYVRHASLLCAVELIHMCDMTHLYVWHDVAQSSHTLCDMSHSYVRHDWFTCVTRFVYMWDTVDSYVRHDSFVCVTWLITCDTNHSYVWHDAFMSVTWLRYMCDMIHSYLWHDSLLCVTRLIHVCDMTHSYVWRASLTCVIGWLECHDSFTRDVTDSWRHVYHDSWTYGRTHPSRYMWLWHHLSILVHYERIQCNRRAIDK